MRRTLFLLLTLLLAACTPGSPKPAALTAAGMDLFTPVKVRLHPLSRIVFPSAAATAPSTQPAPGPTLEARLELTDQFNDPTKGVGDITLKLFDTSAFVEKSTLLAAWSLSIASPQSNREHWDKTTRTYLFKLPIPKDLPPRDHLTLTATLTLPNGTALTDDLSLPLKQNP